MSVRRPIRAAARGARAHASARASQLFESPLGPIRVEADADAVRVVSFARGAEPPASQNGESPAAARTLVDRAVAELREYFSGSRREFSVPLAPDGTRFQAKVWRALQRIPYGSTQSYGTVARAIGKRRAARAAGAANHENPIAVMIPCHRVIGCDHSLVGYGSGLDKKEWLLRHEAKQAGTILPAPAPKPAARPRTRGAAMKVAARSAGR
jgi:methylated-DNA-[protein]-cysteine S-methyltransferase